MFSSFCLPFYTLLLSIVSVANGVEKDLIYTVVCAESLVFGLPYRMVYQAEPKSNSKAEARPEAMTSTFFLKYSGRNKSVGNAPEILSRHTILVSQASKFSLEYVLKSPDVTKK